MSTREPILLVGVGELGGIVLEMLARIPNIGPIVVADSNADWGARKTNSAIEGASYAGLFPEIRFEPIDLLDVDRTSELIARVRPAVVFNGATLQSWWVVNELPPEVNAKLYRSMCGLGPWISMHLALASKLMKAVKASGLEPLVVNSAYPDVTNPSLGRIGLAPTVGIGNSDLIVPYVRKAASERLGIPMRSIGVELVAHHFHAYYWCRAGTGFEAPHHLRVFADGHDVTDALGDREAFVRSLPEHGMRPAGRHGQYVVAASTVKNILALYFDTQELTNAPGPAGLEGGYPVRLGRGGATVVPPRGMTLEQARALNLEAQRYDGVQEIRADGSVVMTPEAFATFQELFGVESDVVEVDTAFEQAMDLRQRFHQFARKHGVDIEADGRAGHGRELLRRLAAACLFGRGAPIAVSTGIELLPHAAGVDPAPGPLRSTAAEAPAHTTRPPVLLAHRFPDATEHPQPVLPQHLGHVGLRVPPMLRPAATPTISG